MPVLVLNTPLKSVVLRQLASDADDRAYFDAQNEDREHITRFDNTVYPTLEDVKKARLNVAKKVLMGIWVGDRCVGKVSYAPRSDGTEAEIGYWLRPSAMGNGYATLAVKTLTEYVRPRFARVFAEVNVDNLKSAEVLKRAGYRKLPGIVDTDYGLGYVFEPK